ncbi:MAG TPA: nuclease-related domain-containing protein [Steroidobacteraceae bacterium]|nr:nuclease-related domain-containing protein [Steroidobacteraceae bacterium]
MDLLRNLPPLTWALVAGAAVSGWGLGWLWRWYRQRRARKALIAAMTAVAVDYLVDVLVPDGMGGSYHVDFVLLTARGAVVIDLRDVTGNVFGGDQMNEWTVMNGAQRFTFINPQSALYDRVAAVKALSGDMHVEGRVVFTSRARFPKGLPKWTLMLESLRTEFPPAEQPVASSITETFGESWRNIKNSVAPSSLAQARQIAAP